VSNIRVRVAGVFVDADKILLVRHQKDGRDYWLLPGGGCEFGESLATALERELEEETSLKTRCGRLLFVNESIPPDRHRHVLNLTFLGEILDGKPRLNESSERLKEVAWVPKALFQEALFFPNIKTRLLAHWESRFSLPTETLGNLWED
jgi:8-oxo-dGTP diphosphatase